MLTANSYDTQNEALVASTGNVPGHRHLGSATSVAISTTGLRLWDTFCECDWSKVVHHGETRTAWQEHVDAVVAGC